MPVVIFSQPGVTPAAPETDPYWSSVVLLARVNQESPNEIEDVSDSAHALTLGSAAEIDTAIFKFPVGSVDMNDSANGYVSAADHADWHPAADDYTGEAYVRWKATPSTSETILGSYTQTGNQRSWMLDLLTSPSRLRFIYSEDGSGNTQFITNWTPTVDFFHHLAFSRNGADLRVFVDGSQLGATHDISTDDLHDSTGDLRIGDRETSVPINAYIQEARVTKGVGRYSSDFTVRTTEYPTV